MTWQPYLRKTPRGGKMMAKRISMQVTVLSSAIFLLLVLVVVRSQKDKNPFFLSPRQHNAGQDQKFKSVFKKIYVVGLGCEREMVIVIYRA